MLNEPGKEYDFVVAGNMIDVFSCLSPALVKKDLAPVLGGEGGGCVGEGAGVLPPASLIRIMLTIGFCTPLKDKVRMQIY